MSRYPEKIFKKGSSLRPVKTLETHSKRTFLHENVNNLINLTESLSIRRAVVYNDRSGAPHTRPISVTAPAPGGLSV